MISKNMAKAIAEQMMNDAGEKHEYGWIITKVYDPDCQDEVGTIGPSNINPVVKDALREAHRYTSEFKKFRMYTDDRNDDEWDFDGPPGLIYEGFFWQAEDNDVDMLFGPLDDFGEPNYGCCMIEYFEDGKWQEV